MSRILAKNNLRTQKWKVTVEDLSPNYADLCIGFIQDEAIIEFDDLRFYFHLTKRGLTEQEKQFPPKNAKYVKSDQEYLVVERLKLEMETNYDLYLWAENDNFTMGKIVTFTTPRPAQPYASWTWDAQYKKWIAPEPYPEDGQQYTWDEQTFSWIVVEETSV